MTTASAPPSTPPQAFVRLQSILTHRIILPPFVVGAGRWGETPLLPHRMDDFSAQMAASAALPRADPAIPRRIFMLWEQGLEAAPDIVKAAHASWRAANPDWEVVLLDRETLPQWVDLSDLHPKLWIATRSDVIRLRLLSQYGGVWVDATTLCMRPLDDWLGPHLRHGFFLFGHASRTRPTSSWFMAGRPGAPLLETWRQAFDGYIRGRRRCFAYYCLHHTFAYLLHTQSTFRALWADTPQLNSDGPHMLKRMLTVPADQVVTPSREALAQVPLFKLSHRKGPEDPDHALPKLAEFGLSPPGLADWA